MKPIGRNVNVKKVSAIAIVTNALQVGLVVGMVLYVLLVPHAVLDTVMAKYILVIAASVVVWGAVVDIREALSTRRLLSQLDDMDHTIEAMESLNNTLRAQRHDFLNHLQVVYSLIEMDEPGEAIAYMDKIYGDMQRVSNMLRTACPAVNALIQAKVVEAGERGAQLKLSIAAKWDDQLMPAWEICRVLANLIDNALDATCAAEHPEGEMPTVELVLGEDLRSWFFSVRNNGPAIDEATRARIFEPGFTTKATGQGMGLFIVSQTLTQLGGKLTLESHEGDTVFSGFVPRKRLELPENTENCEENPQKNDNSIK